MTLPSVRHPALWAVIVTYNRPHELTTMINRLEDQTRPPDRLVVIDNGKASRAAELVSESGGRYISAGSNLGPAGGIALGMEVVLADAQPDDWLLLLDDDDPPPTQRILEELWEFAFAMLERDPSTACVGLVGARYDPRTGRTLRLSDDEISTTAVPVDLLGGGHLPLYRLAAVRAVGPFDASLFFGFEEAEYGLRLRGAGYSLYAHGALWTERRRQQGRIGLHSSRLRSLDSPAWRRYYAARNLTVLARRYGTPRAVLSTAVRAGPGGAWRLLRLGRPAREVVLPLRGVVDGMRSRMGRTIDPGAALKHP